MNYGTSSARSIVSSDLSADPETHSHMLKGQTVRWMAACETWRMDMAEIEDIDSEYVKAIQNLRELGKVSSSFKTAHVRNSVEDKIAAMRRSLEAEISDFHTVKGNKGDELDAKLPMLLDQGRGIWNSLMVYRGCHGAMPQWFTNGKINVEKVAWIATGGGVFFTKMQVKFHEQMSDNNDSDSDQDRKPKARAAKKRAARCLEVCFDCADCAGPAHKARCAGQDR